MGARMFRKGLAVAVILLFIGVAFAIPINANVSKVSLEPVPDLDCDGFLDFSGIEPGDVLYGRGTVVNIGEPFSELDWEVESYPDWSLWTIHPLSGLALTPEDGEVYIDIEVVIQDLPEEEIWDEVKIVNSDNPDDYCCIVVHYNPDSVPVFKNIKQKSIDDTTSIELVFQLIAKLRNHKDIQNIDSKDELLQIIESDEELNSIVEQLSVEDCGCEDEILPLEWKYPVICLLIFPLTWVALYLYFVGGFSWLAEIVGFIGYTLDCFWFF